MLAEIRGGGRDQRDVADAPDFTYKPELFLAPIKVAPLRVRRARADGGIWEIDELGHRKKRPRDPTPQKDAGRTPGVKGETTEPGSAPPTRLVLAPAPPDRVDTGESRGRFPSP
jgi:hypothetical protein